MHGTAFTSYIHSFDRECVTTSIKFCNPLSVHDSKYDSIGEAGQKAIEEAKELIKSRQSKS